MLAAGVHLHGALALDGGAHGGDQAVLELNIKNEEVMARQLQATIDEFEVGEVTRTDVSQAEARLVQSRDQLPRRAAAGAERRCERGGNNGCQ